jgi:hypothetical protein
MLVFGTALGDTDQCVLSCLSRALATEMSIVMDALGSGSALAPNDVLELKTLAWPQALPRRLLWVANANEATQLLPVPATACRLKLLASLSATSTASANSFNSTASSSAGGEQHDRLMLTRTRFTLPE